MRPHQGRGMPSKSRASAHTKPRAKPAPSAHRTVPKKAPNRSVKKPVSAPSRTSGSKTPSRPAAKPATKSTSAEPPVPQLEVPLPGGRRHVLSLSFVRDGDEFMARLETDSGHITELKNRALDQLLTLVAGELEDLLE